MDDELLCLERCCGCNGMLSICRRCYRGQTYCGDACRVPARAAQARAARSTYQRSLRGRRTRRDRNRELRNRQAPITSEMDQGSEVVAPTSSVCLPQSPTSRTFGRTRPSRSAPSARCSPRRGLDYFRFPSRFPRPRASSRSICATPRRISAGPVASVSCAVSSAPVIGYWPNRPSLLNLPRHRSRIAEFRSPSSSTSVGIGRP